jgi:hypothetical protein
MGGEGMSEKPFPPVFATNRPEKGESVAGEINRLLRGLREQLKVAPSIAIATAYLNAQGFELLADELEKAPKVRLLLGAEVQQPEERAIERHPDDRKTLAKALEDHEKGLKIERDLAGFTVERDRAEERLVTWLSLPGEGGAPKVEVRRFTKGFLHGKAYIPEGDITGILAGSSNMTFAGLKFNRELNLGYEGPTHKHLVRDWFEELWAASEAYDLAAIYKERFQEHTPWQVFLRMLVEMYGDPDDADQKYKPVLPLTGFQRDGVARMKEKLDKWGGVLVADEVGLGKTFLAGEMIAEATQQDRQKALVIVPAALKEATWIPFLRQNDLFNMRVTVMSYDELRLMKLEDLETLDEFALVVIDEAHNLRNAATQRADVVRKLMAGRFPKNLILMTATPVNNALMDLHTVLGYYLKNDAALASRGIPSIFRYLKDAQAEDPESLSPVHLFGLLDEVAVRRTRGFIKRYYSGDTVKLPDGREVPIEFPKPNVQRIDYQLSKLGDELLDSVTKALRPDDKDERPRLPGEELQEGRLTLARYVPSRYLKAPEESIDKVQYVNANFLRSNLLKRLESSAHGLANTFGEMINGADSFISAIKEEGKVLRGEALTSWRNLEEDEGYEEMLELLTEETREKIGKAEDYRVDELIADVLADRALLLELQALARKVATLGDAKVEELVKALTVIAEEARRPSRDADLSQGDRRKTIVFSGFADTITDVHEQVSQHIADAKKGSPLADYQTRIAPPVLGQKSGSNQASRAKVLAQFVPATAGPLDNNGKPTTKDNFDLLFTTDVLAEGVNLQQAGRIINYDLPWNPMRLVQRHGRIDRIGSRHRDIFLACFFPATRLDELLKLEETIQRKIAFAAVSVGVGEVIPGQKMKRIEANFAYTREQIEALREQKPELFESGGDSAALSGEEYRLKLSKAFEDGTLKRQVLGLPAGAGSGLISALAKEPGWVFMARVEAGEQTAARVAYVSANAKWEMVRDENGDPIIDLQEMQGLSLADPGSDQVETVLPDAAYQGAFAAWGAAHAAIAREWARLTDGKNLQPDVSQLVRDAREIVLDARSSLITEERNRLAASIAQRWPRRISTRIREALNAGATDADKVMNLKRVAEEEGLQPPPPPKPLPPVRPEDIQLQVWAAVSPLAYQGAREGFTQTPHSTNAKAKK